MAIKLSSNTPTSAVSDNWFVYSPLTTEMVDDCGADKIGLVAVAIGTADVSSLGVAAVVSFGRVDDGSIGVVGAAGALCDIGSGVVFAGVRGVDGGACDGGVGTAGAAWIEDGWVLAVCCGGTDAALAPGFRP
jgi:hypothetical protein